MRRIAKVLTTVVMMTALSARAQEPATTDAASELALRQGRIADKYARLEQLMLKMAEVDGPTNPQRAKLLKQAVQQSKDNLTRTQLETIVKLLDQQQLKRAVDGQTEATTEMKALLDLLLSENRADRNKSEQEKIKEYIKEVERLIRLQKDVQGRTEGGDKTENVAKDQAKIADRTEGLTKKLQEDEDAAKPGDEPMPGEKEPEEDKPESKPEDKPEAKPGDKPADKPEDKPADKPEAKPGDKPAEGDPKPGEKPMPGAGEPMPGEKPMPSEMPPGEQKPMPGAKPMPGQPMPGSESKPPEDSPEQPPPEQNPAKKRLQAAEQKMRDAQKKLEEAKRKDAQDEQEKARQELEKAKAELEEILRQLREEEIERTLAQLEARFRKMLVMQLKVYEATQRLESIPAADRGREIDIEAGRLAVEERKIALEADKAYNLLLEEGSSIAFPESVEQVRIDMEQVADRLAQTKFDPVTVGVEEEIIAALNELIAALQQEQKKREDDKKKEDQPQAQEGGEQEDNPLVDKIAELKMIKSMQLRVNDRTKRFSKMLAQPDDVTGQATDADLTDAISKLGERQEKLHRITRDIVLGKNR